jgi:hypothetical protein
MESEEMDSDVKKENLKDRKYTCTMKLDEIDMSADEEDVEEAKRKQLKGYKTFK